MTSRQFVPNAILARVELTKIETYLMSPSHPTGYRKAAFFRAFGFDISSPLVLADALKAHVAAHPIESTFRTPHGIKFTVVGAVQSPDGRDPVIRSVWIIEADPMPRLITAVPLRARK